MNTPGANARGDSCCHLNRLPLAFCRGRGGFISSGIVVVDDELICFRGV